MKILLVHNDYGKRSGEEAVVDKMDGIFASLGYETAQLRMSTATVRGTLAGKIRVFFAGMWSPAGVRAMRDTLRREKPDVVNIHNLYPFISPASLRECRKAGVPVVMTVHNFRLICPTGLFMRDSAPCEICLERGHEWGCVRHNCEHSPFKSLGYAVRNAVARIGRHYLECVDLFACLTDFQRRKLIEVGFPPEKLIVIPNSIDIKDITPREGTGRYVAFCGRISHEKGIDLIVKVARRHPEIPFRLAGAVGDPSLVADLPANVELVGFVSGKALDDFYDNAAFVLMASRCYEGFSMAILEAAAHSRPTVAPGHGGFTEIIRALCEGGSDQLLFEPGNADSLEAAVTRLWHAPERASALGQTAAANLRRLYTVDVVSQQWKKAVNKVISDK